MNDMKGDLFEGLWYFWIGVGLFWGLALGMSLK
jgi:hypothetical protein